MKGKTEDYVKAKNRINLSTGDVIRVACNMLGINQAELARRSGIAESHISAIIAGKKAIGKVVAGRLAKVLQISPGNILFAGEVPRKGAHIENAIEKRVVRLRAQQNEIKCLVERAMQVAIKLRPSENESGVQNLLARLRRINKINEEEDITGFYLMAKKAFEKSKTTG